jgi:hypothetical protein
MSIEKDRIGFGHDGPFVISCDEPRCNESFDTEEDDFREAIATAKEHGWKIRPDSGPTSRGGWRHTCPICVEDD